MTPEASAREDTASATTKTPNPAWASVIVTAGMALGPGDNPLRTAAVLAAILDKP